MNIWTRWRNVIVVSGITTMLAAAAVVTIIAAGDLNEAAESTVKIGALADAAANVELAFSEASGADALAATGQAEAAAQSAFSEAIARYDSSKAFLSAAGISEVDQAIAGTDQGLSGLMASFNGTLAIAGSGDSASAAANHTGNTRGAVSAVAPAVEGLSLVAAAGDARLTSRLDSGASTLRLVGWFSIVVAAMGAMFAGWLAWSSTRPKEEAAVTVSEFESADSIERAA